MDESYYLTVARYVELNPVRAKLVSQPEDYRRSSASAHLSGRDDMLVKDFREPLELFNKHNVEYMIVGGYALAFHQLCVTPVI